jgi:hypothetical protein
MRVHPVPAADQLGCDLPESPAVVLTGVSNWVTSVRVANCREGRTGVGRRSAGGSGRGSEMSDLGDTEVCAR